MDQLDQQRTRDLDQLRMEYRLLSEKEKRLRVIHDFAIVLLQQRTVDDIVWSIARHAIAKLGFVDCVIYLMDEEQNLLVQKAAHGPKNPEKLDIMNPITIPLGKGIVGTVAEKGKPEIIGDTSQDPRYILDDVFRYSEIAVPIKDGNRVIGVIDSEHPQKHFFTDEHLHLLETIAAMASSKILYARTAEQLVRHKDGLEQEIEEKTTELKQMISHLQKSNSDLERFIYAASHDLAEPLRTISNFLQLIKRREEKLSEESTEYINFAVDGAHRMKKLLDGLLLYSKVGKRHDHFEMLNPIMISRTTQSNLSRLIEEKRASVHFGNMQPFRGNEAGILQLFQNLTANAIKFHHPDRRPTVSVLQTEEENHFRFEFRDNGIGMEEVFFEKVFQLFGRLHTIRDYQGSGLGLSICKSIVENHGGEIWLESELDQGTSVFFTIKK